MNDNDIIKLLKTCSVASGCKDCRFADSTDCAGEVSAMALDLINRHKAEIEGLEKRLEEEKHALFEQQAYTAELQAVIERLQKQLDSKCDRCIARDREKAIKEFAQLVKEHLDDFYHTDDGSLLDTVSMVDLLVKEMTEDQSENK